MEKLFIDLFDELGMQQMIEVPTHEQGNALDLCFVSNSSFIRNINVLTKNEICSSDHFGITFELTSRAKIKSSKRIVFDFKRANWNDLSKDLNSVPWDQHILSCDPSEEWYFFRNKIHSLIKIHRLPWFDSETLNLCKKKARLHKKASEIPANYDRFSEWRKRQKLMIEEKWKLI